MTSAQQKALKSAIKALIDMEQFDLASTLMDVIKKSQGANWPLAADSTLITTAS